MAQFAVASLLITRSFAVEPRKHTLLWRFVNSHHDTSTQEGGTVNCRRSGLREGKTVFHEKLLTPLLKKKVILGLEIDSSEFWEKGLFHYGIERVSTSTILYKKFIWTLAIRKLTIDLIKHYLIPKFINLMQKEFSLAIFLEDLTHYHI